MTPEFLDQIISAAGRDNVMSEPADCWPYGYDNSGLQGLPDAVVLPHSHRQVRDIIRLCNHHHTALIPRGRGTGTTGATVPLQGGLVMSFERMAQITRIDPGNRLMIVEPGVTNQSVQEEAARHGFFWPPDPTSAAFCTVGGNLAYNSAGPRAVKYGTPRENVLGLRTVTGAGLEIRTGVHTTKGVVGYDLTRLIIGSEGTLAVITEAILKLTPLAETRRTLQALYSDIRGACEAVSRIMAQPVIPCALEFIDAQAIKIIRSRNADIELPEDAGAMLMIEVDGPRAGMDAALARVCDAAQTTNLLQIKSAASAREADALWAARKALSPALRTLAPKKINEDVVVPVTEIPALISALNDLARRHAITIVSFGHAGNGNIHVNLLIDPDDPPQAERARCCLDKIFGLVLKLNGTLSGEHGVGLAKRDFIEREIEPPALDLMRGIKAQFDPQGILNPGKMLPAAI